MLSKNYDNFILGCSDFNREVQNSDMIVTPENAYHISFRFLKSSSTQLMANFLDDEKTYMVFRFGFLMDNYTITLIAKHEPYRASPSRSISFTSLKNALVDDPWIHETDDGRLTCYISQRLHPLVQSIYSTLPHPIRKGLFTISDPVIFKAQLPSDRHGFYKEYIRGELRSEKNYGHCSMVFSIVGLLID